MICLRYSSANVRTFGDGGNRAFEAPPRLGAQRVEDFLSNRGTTRWFLAIVGALALLPNSAFSAVPSCNRYADQQSAPGVSPPCAPALLSTASAHKLLGGLRAMSIKGHYVVIWTSANRDVSILWKALALTISSVQSLYLDHGDVYIIRGPRTKSEMDAVQSGNVPKELIYAYARYAPFVQLKWNSERIPRNYIPFPYVLTVKSN